MRYPLRCHPRPRRHGDLRRPAAAQTVRANRVAVRAHLQNTFVLTKPVDTTVRRTPAVLANARLVFHEFGGASIQRLASEGLLIKGGGHKMAAGLTVTRANLQDAMQRLTELLAKQGADALGPRDLTLDSVLMPGAATVELIEQIETAGPFGAGAPAPRFAFPGQKVAFAKRVGANHLKLTISDGLGGKLDAISFGAFDTPLGEALANHGGAPFHFAGRLEVNTWQGRQTPQLRLEDAAQAK